MKRKQWKKTIIDQMKKIDTDYIASFETTINVLSEILEERDNVYEAYQADGSRPVIIFKTDRGQENPKPNPLLKQWEDLNTSALHYLRELGITPAGLRKLQGQIPKRSEIDTSWLTQLQKKCGVDNQIGARNRKGKDNGQNKDDERD